MAIRVYEVGNVRYRLVYLIKVDVPNLVYDLTWTPIFEWCIVEFELKNKVENLKVLNDHYYCTTLGVE